LRGDLGGHRAACRRVAIWLNDAGRALYIADLWSWRYCVVRLATPYLPDIT